MTAGRILVLNGPNLNLLGDRQPAVYGRTTLAEIEADLQERATALGVEVSFFQSNHEGALIDQLHVERGRADGVVINPGAYGHSSIALRDAFLATELPLVEVHLSNIYAREPFRHHSYLSDIAVAVISGAGADGYRFGLELLASPRDS